MAERVVIDGQPVVEVFEIPSDTAPTGQPRRYTHFEGLRLEDGTEKYRCTEPDCGWIGDRKNSLTGHRKKHSLHLSQRVRDLPLGALVDAYLKVNEDPDLSPSQERLRNKVAEQREEIKRLRKENRDLHRQWDNLKSLLQK